MKRSVFAASFAFIICLSSPAWGQAPAAHGPFGLGVILGEPTGISAKLFMGDRNAADLGLAWAFKNELFAVHADWLLSFPGLVVVQERDFPPFVGLGAYLHAIGAAPNGTSELAFGVRFPLGIAHLFSAAPLELSLEVVPCLALVPGTDFDLQGAIAIRWYF